MRVPRPSPAVYRKVTLVAAVLLAVIIVTGAAVRLTNSGLGCPAWPNCAAGRLTPHGASDSHQWVEFVNRVFTGAGRHSGGGRHDDVSRLDLSVREVARLHGSVVMLFLGLVLVTVWTAHRLRVPEATARRLTVLLVLLVAQAGVGYAQYFSG